MGKVIPVGQDAIESFALAVGVVGYAIMANLCYTLGWGGTGRQERGFTASEGAVKKALAGRSVVFKPFDELAFLARSCILAAP